MKIENSPVTQHDFNGTRFYLKRDDLLHPQFSGNKARKFMGLLESEFPKHKNHHWLWFSASELLIFDGGSG